MPADHCFKSLQIKIELEKISQRKRTKAQGRDFQKKPMMELKNKILVAIPNKG